MSFMILGAILISFAPIFIKAIHLIDPSMIGFYRCLMAGLILTPWSIWSWFKRRPVNCSSSQKKEDKRVFIYLLLAGLLFSFDLATWNRSVIYAGAGLGTLLGNTQAIYLALLGVFWAKEKIGGTTFFMLMLALWGVYWLVGIGEGAWANELYRRGIFYGLSTGIFYAGYIFCMRQVEQAKDRFTTLQRLTLVSYFTAFFLFLLAIVGGEKVFSIPSLMDLFWTLMMAIVAQILGWWAIGKGLSKVPLSISGLLLLIQPVASMIMGYFLFGETLTSKQLGGMILTLVAIYWAGFISKKKRSKDNFEELSSPELMSRSL